MSTTLLKPKGVHWRDLSRAEKSEIEAQIPNIKADPSLYDMKFYKTQYHKWIICNIWSIPKKFGSVI